jgi:hypothetical protein
VPGVVSSGTSLRERSGSTWGKFRKNPDLLCFGPGKWPFWAQTRQNSRKSGYFAPFSSWISRIIPQILPELLQTTPSISPENVHFSTIPEDPDEDTTPESCPLLGPRVWILRARRGPFAFYYIGASDLESSAMADRKGVVSSGINSLWQNNKSSQPILKPVWSMKKGSRLVAGMWRQTSAQETGTADTEKQLNSIWNFIGHWNLQK